MFGDKLYIKHTPVLLQEGMILPSVMWISTETPKG